MFRLIENLA